MDSFEDRKKGFEKKFAHDEEKEFKISARRNKYISQWVSSILGYDEEKEKEYLKLTPEVRDMIMDVVSSQDPGEAQTLINYFNTQTPPIPYAEEFPQLNTIAQGE